MSAYGGNLLPSDVDFFDTYLVNLRFRGGALGRLRAGMSPRGVYEGEIVFASNVSATFGWGKLTLHRPRQDPELLDPKAWTHPAGYVRELGSFTRWVLAGETPLITAADGRAAVELGIAAYRSIEEGRPFDLPL